MNQIIIESVITGLTSLILALMIIPVLIKFSSRLGLIDKPNYRKVHSQPIPVIGGISIAVSTGLSMLLSKTSLHLPLQYPVLAGACVLLLVVGVWDDRKNIRPVYRLLLQLLCAGAVCTSGIRLTSLYGIMGIAELPVYLQYLLTIIIITGVTNAFNLMDGIDGLAGGLAFINITILAVLSFIVKEYALFLLLVAVGGAIIGFLKNNLHPARIFMGDGGSLMLGFLMSAAGILLIEKASGMSTIKVESVVILVTIILVIPVFDSLRVYASRIGRGESPFKADRTHLHHLFLHFGFNHKKVALLIYGLEILLLALGLLIQQMAAISVSLLLIVLVFFLVSQLLTINSQVEKWLKKIRNMENSH